MKRKTRKNKRQVTRKKRSRGGTITGPAKAARKSIKQESANARTRKTISFEHDETLTVLNPFSGAGFILGSRDSGKVYKIVIGSPDNNFKSLDPPLSIEWGGKLVNINKVTEPSESVQNEFNRGRQVFLATSKNNGYPACFNPYDFFNRNNTDAKVLLNKLLEKTIDLPARAMLQYILTQLVKNPSFGLRVIGMEKAPKDYVSLRTYLTLDMPEIKDQMFFLAALIVNIYMKTKFYSLDNSLDNFMGKQNEWKSFDFGLLFDGTETPFGNMRFPPNVSNLESQYDHWRNMFRPIHAGNFLEDLGNINNNIGNLCSPRVSEDDKVTILDRFFQFVSLIDFCNMMLVFSGQYKFPRIYYILQYIYGKDTFNSEYITDDWERRNPVFYDKINYRGHQERVKGNLLEIIRIVCAMSQSQDSDTMET